MAQQYSGMYAPRVSTLPSQTRLQPRSALYSEEVIESLDFISRFCRGEPVGSEPRAADEQSQHRHREISAPSVAHVHPFEADRPVSLSLGPHSSHSVPVHSPVPHSLGVSATHGAGDLVRAEKNLASAPFPVFSPPTNNSVPMPRAWDPSDASSPPTAPKEISSKDLTQHQQTIYNIAMYLKNHFAVDENEIQRDMISLDDADILGLAQCFYVDLFELVHVIRDPQNSPPQPPGAIAPMPISAADPSLADPSPLGHGLYRATSLNDPSAALTVTLPSHPKATLREMIVRMRQGSFLVKYGRDSKPRLRFFNLQDKSIAVDGREVTMPHLSWSADVRAKPSGQLCLTHLLSLTYGSASQNFKHDKNGIILGLDDQPVSSSMCFTLTFVSRTVDVAAQSKSDFAMWTEGLQAVIERNQQVGAVTRANP